jgi:hypothetical protein
MKCSSLLLHCGQANVRKCWLHMLGSITANLMGESQATHCGLFVEHALPLCWAGGVIYDSMLKLALATRKTSILSNGSR